jgi:hypothetical protein
MKPTGRWSLLSSGTKVVTLEANGLTAGPLSQLVGVGHGECSLDITERHGVTAQEFDEAWHDRDAPRAGRHPKWGAYYEGYGYTNAGKSLYLVWRWQVDKGGAAVWPITAFEDES